MRRIALLVVVPLAVAAGLAGAVTLASAHECHYSGKEHDTGKQTNCHETPAQPNWRDGNYVPLFDLDNRNDPQQRKNAQRWRGECQGYDEQGNYRSDQYCAWARGGNSWTPGMEDELAPNELHLGFAASHCFIGEFMHQCEGHDARHGEGVHDAHGGAIYLDACLEPNPESKYCKNGVSDTQIGVTVMDHNPCGLIVPIVACIDEYHLIRPADPDFTSAQMDESAAYAERIAADPELYVCGYEQYRDGLPVCP